MKRKKLTGLALAMILCMSFLAPMKADAASTVRVKSVYGGTTATYKNKKTYCYVNKKKISLSKTPIFMSDGTYVGPISSILKNSSLKVKASYKGKTVTLKYGPNTVKLTSGSKTVVTNGVKSTMGAPAFDGIYTSNGLKRWIVPLKSVCIRLGISYKLSGGVIYISGAANTSGTKSTTSIDDTNTSSGGKISLVIDAGHGGADSGATGNGLAEKNLNLAIVLAAKKYFSRDSKFKVYYTRTSDSYPSLTNRCKLANTQNVDMFICVHINSASASANGTETLWNPKRNSSTAKKGLTSRELATALHNSTVDATGFKNRGLKSRTDLCVLNRTNMPACLIEYGFISNKTEARKMKLSTSLYGKALYQSVVNLMKKEGRY